MNRPPLFIRADASSSIGIGHVMRMLALAHAWRRVGGYVVFACAEITPSLEVRLKSEGFAVQHLTAQPGSVSDAEQTIRLLRNVSSPSFGHPPSDLGSQLSDLRPPTSDIRSPISDLWLAADGYHFPESFQRVIKGAGGRLLVMDDNGENRTYMSDLVLNQNIGAQAEWYRDRAPDTKLLLGTRYVLLRPEFLDLRDTKSVRLAGTRRVLVTMGGADPVNATGLVLDSLVLLDRPDDEVVVVVGGSNPRYAELEQQTSRFRWKSVRLLRGVSDMATLMHDVDIAITAGGSTCWELCLLGIPMLALVIADNQRAIVRGLVGAGVAVDAGEAGCQDAANLATLVGHLLDDDARRTDLSVRARLVVDGRGAERVRDAMLASSGDRR